MWRWSVSFDMDPLLNIHYCMNKVVLAELAVLKRGPELQSEVPDDKEEGHDRVGGSCPRSPIIMGREDGWCSLHMTSSRADLLRLSWAHPAALHSPTLHPLTLSNHKLSVIDFFYPQKVYSNAVLKYLTLVFPWYVVLHVMHKLYCISKGDFVIFPPLQLFNDYSSKFLLRLKFYKQNIIINKI